MKFILTLLLFLPFTICAQQFALIDKNFKLPILYTDSVTVEQVKQGFFPIENRAVDTLVANIKYLKQILEVRQRAKMQAFELNSK